MIPSVSRVPSDFIAVRLWDDQSVLDNKADSVSTIRPTFLRAVAPLVGVFRLICASRSES